MPQKEKRAFLLQRQEMAEKESISLFSFRSIGSLDLALYA
jgi:hypothetical protein